MKEAGDYPEEGFDKSSNRWLVEKEIDKLDRIVTHITEETPKVVKVKIEAGDLEDTKSPD